MLRLLVSLALIVLVSCEAGGVRSADDLERATARPTAEPERWQLGETPVF